MEVVRFSGSSSELLPSLRSLFYMTAENLPEDEDKLSEFRRKWLTSYVVSPTGLHLVAADELEIFGYIISETDTLGNAEMMETHESLRLFAPLLKEYTVHFHINVHPDYQGKGIGKRLINQFIGEVDDKGLKKIGVVTALYAENVSFYRKVGFRAIESKMLNGVELVFMGRDTL